MKNVARETDFIIGDRVATEWMRGIQIQGEVIQALDDDAGLYLVRFDNGMITECFSSSLDLLKEE